jgi:hypothetical protein
MIFWSASRDIINMAEITRLSLTDPHGPPEKPVGVTFRHPANGLPFLVLPEYDLISRSPLKFGIHHQTAITACCILACNESGYLSTSRERDSGRVDDGLDAIIPIGDYFYHLDNPGSDTLYPICIDFATWKFPHNALPLSWGPLLLLFVQTVGPAKSENQGQR